MNMKSKILFVGAVNVGGIADDGETMKNRILINSISKNINEKIFVIDTRNRPKRIFYMIKYILLLLLNKNAKIIFSASSFVTYKLIKIAYRLGINPQNIYYWVIGGKYADFVEQGRIKKDLYLPIKHIFVEGDSMRHQLNKLGYKNVSTFPNFKEIKYIPKRSADCEGVIKFVFLSRIIPQKGVDLIIEASKYLNQKYSEQFIVDFYGKIEASYKDNFLDRISGMANVNYKGFLNLTENSGYDKLATYDAMLFPTYWDGEGFPGIVIDAYIAGLPIIASDWNLNSQIIKEGITGYLIPVKDCTSLIEAMQKCIERKVDLCSLSKNVQLEVMNYDADTIINNNFLENIGLI